MSKPKLHYTLGIDLGSQSIGWAVCPCNQNGEVTGIENLGVRIFDDGRDAKSHEPLAVGRRLAKQTSRRRKRAFMRRQALLKFLRDTDLLPHDPAASRELASLDPYEIRASAVRKRVSRHEVGRALLHINKRRGFKSGRKQSKEDDKEAEGMKRGIQELHEALKGRTLGEFLFERKQAKKDIPLRFRPQVTGSGNQWEFYPERAMYEQEIRAIFKEQSKHYDDLTDDTLQRLLHIIIDQRPLRKPRIGSCRFFAEDARAPLALPSSQLFRIFQEASNLELRADMEFRLLHAEERQAIIDQLTLKAERRHITKRGELSFAKIKSKIIEDSGVALNLEEMGRKGLQVDLTALALSSEECFGKAWFDLSLDQQDAIVLKLVGAEDKEIQDDDESVCAWLTSEFGLTDKQAGSCLHAKLPDGYGRLGVRAIKELLPYMIQGLKYAEAIEAAGLVDPLRNVRLRQSLPYYGEILENYTMPHPADGRPDVPLTPEVKFGRIPNPTVHIGLNQLRKVVNAIIEKYGPPTVIRVELTRDFAFSASQTAELKKRQTLNRQANDEAREEIVKAGQDPENKGNVLRYKLWRELNPDPIRRCCPFSGKVISIADLFSSSVEIEHILPFSRTFDDSFNNKTLCYREINRSKANKTPFEAFGDSPEYSRILDRVQVLEPGKRWRFREDAMERFLRENPDLIARTLNDTRYLSKVAKSYMQAVCPSVQSVRGAMTSALRHFWGLNSILSDSDDKERNDHRHHAIDAFVVAASTPSFLLKFQNLTAESKLKFPDRNPLKLHVFPHPWDQFDRNEIAVKVRRLLVSHKQSHILSQHLATSRSTPGPLHKETFYGLEQTAKSEAVLKIRRPVTDLKPKDCANIASPRLRAYFIGKSEEFSKPSDWKKFLEGVSTSGRIRRVRMLEKKSKDTIVGFQARDGRAYRYAMTGSNAWADVIEIHDRKGRKKWLSMVASVFESTIDPNGQPTWKKEYPAARKIARIFPNDIIALKGADDLWRLYRVKKLRKDGRIYVRDPRLAQEDQDKMSIGLGASRMLRDSFTKVAIGPLGDLRAPSHILQNLYVGPIYRDPE